MPTAPVRKSLLWGIIGRILSTLLGIATPEIKKLLDKFINELYVKAKATSNPVDDLLVEFLASILDIELPD